MHLIPRTLSATSVAVALTLAVTVGASAQVASLVSPDETPEPETTETVLEFEDREEALLAFAQCMRDNGVDMDDPVIGEGGGGRAFGPGGGGPGGAGGGFDQFSDEFRSAQETCGTILESARPEIDPEAEQERLEEQLLLAQCIRDAGYEEYPDPKIGENGRLERTGGRGFQTLGIDPRSGEFREITGACRDELGLEQFGPGGPGFGRGGN